ncbi:MAG: hypothetical protein CVV13_08805 [Gammaproteobacteria bacterium HGW-Gammaproteobacteria-3]|nr:MAG: hypothetical protein CVV13_08805 [Gammaproteobacteria bacterium HGW-Gammaproteobacteria-3]
MKIPTHLKNIIIAAVTGMAIAAMVSGCSDEQKPKTKTPVKSAKINTHNGFDHAHGKDVSDFEKHKFEHEFADQCVAREVQQAVNKNDAKARFTKPCMCIAKFMMKDLTAREAEKFLDEHKNTQSLRIRFENAAYHCLQDTNQPKAPDLFGKR